MKRYLVTVTMTREVEATNEQTAKAIGLEEIENWGYDTRDVEAEELED